MNDATLPHPSTRDAIRYSITPIASELAQRIRQTLVDNYGNQLAVWVSEYAAPCRHCLRLAPAGSSLIVFAYSPFSSSGPYAEVGPVFVHAGECERYAARDIFPSDHRDRVLTLRGYNERGTIEAAVLSVAGDPESSITELFADERVRFIHARSPAWGCYHFRLDRA